MPRESSFDSKRPKLGRKKTKPIVVPEIPSQIFSILLEDKDKYKALIGYFAKFSNALEEGFLERFLWLLETYDKKGLNINDPWELLFAVIRDYVPDFQVVAAKKASAKPAWDDKSLFQLWDDIENELLNQNANNKGVLPACKKLIKTNQKYKKYTPENLQNIFSKAKKSVLVKGMIHIRESEIPYSQELYTQLISGLRH